MFDIGFWEIALIGIIALLVVGPERLPALARNVGLWVGRMRRYVSHVRDDIEREINAEEVRKLIETPTESIGGFDEMISETKSVINDAENQFNDIQREADNLEDDSDPAEVGISNSADVQANENGPFSVENTQQLNPAPEVSEESSPEVSSQTSLDLTVNETESNSETVVESTESTESTESIESIESTESTEESQPVKP
jgi:sec-independent protein translocase protein TatB